MSRLFFLKALIFLFPLFSGLHAQEAHAPLSHVMVLGDVKDADLTKLESCLPQKTASLPSLDYETPTFQEKREQWIQFFSKTLLEERLSFRLGNSVQCFFFPSADHSPLNACALIGQEDELATLETSLLELQQISLHGITEWELTKAKEQAWDQLYNTSSELAEESSIVLQSISTKDIQKYLSPLYSHVADDLNLNGDVESEYEEDSILVQLCSNQVNDINPFYSLAISDSDKKTIHCVIHTLTKWNKLTSDKDIQQESILKLLRAFPNIPLVKYFPTHAEIIRLSKKSD